MKKWIQEGIQTEKLELAIQAYMQRKTDLHGGAAIAGISYNRFMDEVQRRNIIILEDDHFLDSLASWLMPLVMKRCARLSRKFEQKGMHSCDTGTALPAEASQSYSKNCPKYFFVNNNIFSRNGGLLHSGPCGSKQR
jgi:hypothetical protein